MAKEQKLEQLLPFCEFFRVAWRVERFSFSLDRSYSLRSPVFATDTLVPCKWFLGLEWNPPDLEDQFIDVKVHLIRKCKAGDKNIRGTVEIGCETINNDEVTLNEPFNGFLNSDSTVNANFSPFFVEDTIKANTDDFFIIICKIILYNDIPLEDFSFSLENAQKMSSKEKELNYTIVLCDGEIKTNKALLCSSSPILRSLIQDSSEDDRLFLTSESHENMEELLFHLHHDRFDFHPMAYVSFELFKIVIKYKLSLFTFKLIYFYITSQAGGGNCEFEWQLKSFNANCVRTFSAVTDFCSNLICHVHLINDDDYVGIYFEIPEEYSKIDLFITVGVFEEDGKLSCYKVYALPFPNGKVFGTLQLFPNVPQSSLKKLVVKMIFSDLIFEQKIRKITETHSTNIKLTSPAFSKQPSVIPPKDLAIIRALDETFKVHCSVLRAKSTTFAKMIDRDITKHKRDLVFNINGNIMKLILVFLYCGKLYVEDIDTCVDVLEVSLRIDVTDLTKVCYSYLSSYLDYSVCSIFLRSCKFNPTFKQYVLKYICKNAKKILSSKEWEKLGDEKMKFKNEVCSALFKAYGLSKERTE